VVVLLLLASLSPLLHLDGRQVDYVHHHKIIKALPIPSAVRDISRWLVAGLLLVLFRGLKGKLDFHSSELAMVEVKSEEFIDLAEIRHFVSNNFCDENADGDS
jgi:hypothetical protein